MFGAALIGYMVAGVAKILVDCSESPINQPGYLKSLLAILAVVALWPVADIRILRLNLRHGSARVIAKQGAENRRRGHHRRFSPAGSVRCSRALIGQPSSSPLCARGSSSQSS